MNCPVFESNRLKLISSGVLFRNMWLFRSWIWSREKRQVQADCWSGWGPHSEPVIRCPVPSPAKANRPQGGKGSHLGTNHRIVWLPVLQPQPVIFPWLRFNNGFNQSSTRVHGCLDKQCSLPSAVLGRAAGAVWDCTHFHSSLVRAGRKGVAHSREGMLTSLDVGRRNISCSMFGDRQPFSKDALVGAVQLFGVVLITNTAFIQYFHPLGRFAALTLFVSMKNQNKSSKVKKLFIFGRR